MVPSWPGGGRPTARRQRPVNGSRGVSSAATIARSLAAPLCSQTPKRPARRSRQSAAASSGQQRALMLFAACGLAAALDGELWPCPVGSTSDHHDCADSLATAIAAVKVAQLRDVVPRLGR